MKSRRLILKVNAGWVGAARGVTLVEMLVVLSLFILISSFLVSLSIQYQSLYNLGEANYIAVGNARSVLNSIGVYTVQAHRVVESRTIAGATYVTGTSTVVLQIPAVDLSGDIVSDAWDYVVFRKTSTSSVYRHIEADPNSARVSGERLLGSTVGSLVFTYNNVSTTLATKVSVDIESNRIIGHVEAANHETADYILRNY